MRLVMTIMVRDEIDVLPVVLDAHLALGVDHIVATDNGSTDGSAELLRAYAERGVVTLLEGDPATFDQAATVTAMARHAATELDADWVLNVDADEVWWPVAGTLPDVLDAVPDEFGVMLVSITDFSPAPPGSGPFWERMVIRETAGVSFRGGRLVPKAAHRARADVTVTFGNHDAQAPGLHWAPPLPLIEVLHFPVRSPEQLERKVRAILERRVGAGREPVSPPDAAMLRQRLESGSGRDWYEELVAQGEAGLADGSSVRDERLAGLARAEFARRPRRPGVTISLRGRFATFAGWDLARRTAAQRELAAVTAEREGCIARIRELEDLRDLLDHQLEATRVELRQSVSELERLSRSRALRAAAVARRALGR